MKIKIFYLISFIAIISTVVTVKQVSTLNPLITEVSTVLLLKCENGGFKVGDIVGIHSNKEYIPIYRIYAEGPANIKTVDNIVLSNDVPIKIGGDLNVELKYGEFLLCKDVEPEFIIVKVGDILGKVDIWKEDF